MDKVAFINLVKGQAIKEMKEHGVLASLTIAQAILESGWGESGLTKKANNLFGVKADRTWKGPYEIMPTKEFENGKYVNVDAKFRKYTSWSDSIADHTQFLMFPRYKNLIGDKDYKSVCKKVQSDGYATSPTYAAQLINIIEQNKLYEFDVIEDYRTPEEKKTSGIVTATKLNVREKPDENSRILGTLNQYDNVKISKLVGDWYSIYYGTNGGYVNKKYIR